MLNSHKRSPSYTCNLISCQELFTWPLPTDAQRTVHLGWQMLLCKMFPALSVASSALLHEVCPVLEQNVVFTFVGLHDFLQTVNPWHKVSLNWRPADALQLSPPILLRVHYPIIWEYRKTINNIKTRIHHRLTTLYIYFKVIATNICGQEELTLNKTAFSLNWGKYHYFSVAFPTDAYQHNTVVGISTLQAITPYRANALTHLDKQKHPSVSCIPEFWAVGKYYECD